MDRSSRLLDELKIAEARYEPADSWSESDRRGRREVRRLRAEWEDEQTRRSVGITTLDPIDEADGELG